MRFASVLPWILLIGFAVETPGAQEMVRKTEDGPRVEFYVAGRFRPASKYRVKSFRLVGKNSPELAASFHGLAAEGLNSGEYHYILTPENPPQGQIGDLDLLGRVSLYGPYSYWITLQMPVGTYAEGAMFPLTGRVLPPPGEGREPIWIRFQHVVAHTQVVQAKLAGDGIFQIPNSIPFTGSVVVTVCRGADVLFLDVVHFSGGQPEHPLELRLRKSPL